MKGIPIRCRYLLSSPISTPITLFLIQLLVVGILSKLLARLFKFIKQPSVIAEVVTGILLGKSAMGIFCFFFQRVPGKVNGYMDTLFPATSLATFNVVANFGKNHETFNSPGLILFMFLVGLEVDIKLMKKNVTNALIISLSAMATPFVLVD